MATILRLLIDGGIISLAGNFIRSGLDKIFIAYIGAVQISRDHREGGKGSELVITVG